MATSCRELHGHARDLSHRRDRPRRRPLLPVQALLPELPLYAAARFRARLPAPAAALEGAPHAARRRARVRTRLMRDTATDRQARPASRRGLTNWALKNPANRVAHGGARSASIAQADADLSPRDVSRSGGGATGRGRAGAAAARGVEAPTPLQRRALLDLPGRLQRSGGRRARRCGCSSTTASRWCGRRGRSAAACRFSTAATSKRRRRRSAATSRSFTPFVEQGYAIVIPSPSCSLMVREEFPQLVAGPRRDRLAQRTHDLDEYLYRIAREGRLKRDFQRRFGRVQYHVPCHIRVQNIGIRGRDLLELVADQVDCRAGMLRPRRHLEHAEGALRRVAALGREGLRRHARHRGGRALRPGLHATAGWRPCTSSRGRAQDRASGRRPGARLRSRCRQHAGESPSATRPSPSPERPIPAGCRG